MLASEALGLMCNTERAAAEAQFRVSMDREMFARAEQMLQELHVLVASRPCRLAG